jgi:hypothetical protein
MPHIHTINIYYYFFDAVIFLKKIFEAVYAFALKISKLSAYLAYFSLVLRNYLVQPDYVYGSQVDSASNRNEYQESSWG